MKVTSFDTKVIRNVEPFIGGRWWLFIELHTDEGITGLGERITGGAYSNSLDDLKTQVHLIKELVEQYVIGEDPFNSERIWDRMYASRHDFRHPSLYATPVISGIDIALWDIRGKATNQPIYNLLGGKYHEKLRAYAYVPGMREIQADPSLAGAAAEKLLEEGNSACKLDPFMPMYPIPRDITLQEIDNAAKIFENIRDAVGNALEVGIGTHGQLTTFSAIRVANFLEPYHPYWFEEPVPPENVEEMARVAAHTSIPIATGERLVTKYEFSNLLEKGAASILQLDVGQCGGITESKKIAAIAEAHYAMIAPHMYCGPIAASAAIQIDTCSPNFLIQEANLGPLHKTIFKEPLELQNGFIIPPTGPGLGIEFDEAVLKAHLVE
ncbi:MAG: mandelate racemase/muconate lactonizing enzyme family protein [Gammaproteobacteria bacterium]|nr:mandelate racemase/muconate lactonizing enzyme family protein [Gammaproteobacteria bacterium]